MKVTCLGMLPKGDTKMGEVKVTDVKTHMERSVHRQTAYLISPVLHCGVTREKVQASSYFSALYKICSTQFSPLYIVK